MEEKGPDLDAVDSRENATATGTALAEQKAGHYGTVDHFMTEDGRIRLVPVPTTDPLDPLNMPSWRKWTVVGALCLYGSIALAAQMAVGAMVPVFVLEYSHMDPKMLKMGAPPAPPPGPHGHRNIDLTKSFPAVPGAPSAQAVSMLASLPQLFIGISNFIAIPMAEVFGRRPTVLLMSLLSFVLIPWCAKSTNLSSHLAARCIHALGAGASESLVPLILQDITFLHQRNGYMSLYWGAIATMSMVFGISGSHIVTDIGWRYLYWILSGPAGLSFVLLLIFMPETKMNRTQDELEGRSSTLAADKLRPEIDYGMYGRKRWGWSLFRFLDWPAGYRTIREFVLVLLFVNIIWLVLLNSIFIGANISNSMTSLTLLILPPYKIPMANAGTITLSLMIGAFLAFLITGLGGDWLVIQLTKRNRGRREPEHQLINLVIPILVEMAGLLLYGNIGDHPERFPWIAVYVSVCMNIFGFLAVNSVASVYAVECYPKWAGSVLVMVTGLRNIVACGISFAVYDWVDLVGFVGVYGTFAGLVVAIGAGIIPVWYYGKQIRAYTGRITRKYD